MRGSTGEGAKENEEGRTEEYLTTSTLAVGNKCSNLLNVSSFHLLISGSNFLSFQTTNIGFCTQKYSRRQVLMSIHLNFVSNIKCPLAWPGIYKHYL